MEALCVLRAKPANLVVRLRLTGLLSQLLDAKSLRFFLLLYLNTTDGLNQTKSVLRCGRQLLDHLKPAGSGVILPTKLWDRHGLTRLCVSWQVA